MNAMSPKLITTLKTLVELSGGDDPMTEENFPDLIALLSARFNRPDLTMPEAVLAPKKVVSFMFQGSAKFLVMLMKKDPALVLPDFFHGCLGCPLEQFVNKDGDMSVDWRKFNPGVCGTGMCCASNVLCSH